MLALSRALLARARVVLVDEPAQGMSPTVAARTYELLGGLDACVVVAEQRLPPGLHERPGRTTYVHELRRGTVVFSGEAAEVARATTGATGATGATEPGAGRTGRGPNGGHRPNPSG